jgi:hypothetical protein
VKIVDFDIENETFEAGCSAVPCSRWRELALTIQQGGQNQQDQQHNKQQDPDAMIQIPGAGVCSGNLLAIDRHPVAQSDC